MNPKRGFGIMLVAATLLVCAAPSAWCQATGPGMGYGKGGRMYNPKTETTVSGTVEQVRTISRGAGWGGTHLDLKTGTGTLDIHVGPSRYVASKGFTFAKGDKIEVTGSKVSFHEHDAIIAREIKIGGKVLTLRNDQGIPEWAGGRRGGGPGTGRSAGAPPM
jgi:hypothetical protein